MKLSIASLSMTMNTERMKTNRTLPSTPMLATAAAWSGPTRSWAVDASPSRNDVGLPDEVDLAEAERRETVRPRLEDRGQLLAHGGHVADELEERVEQGLGQDHHDRQERDDQDGVDGDDRDDARQARHEPQEEPDRRREDEGEQPGQEEGQDDVGEEVPVRREVGEDHQPEGDRAEDQERRQPALLALVQGWRRLLGHRLNAAPGGPSRPSRGRASRRSGPRRRPYRTRRIASAIGVAPSSAAIPAAVVARARSAGAAQRRPIFSRTSAIVASASGRSRAAPSSRTPSTTDGLAISSA